MNTVSSNAPLVINQLSKNIYNELLSQGQLQSNQLYIVEEDNLDANSAAIVNVSTPITDTDAANKKYVDDISSNVVNNIKTDITNTLTGYVENSELTEYAKNSTLTEYATKTHLTNTLTGYVENSELTEYAKNSTLTDYATKTHLTNTLTGYVENSELTDYATKTHLTNTLTGYVENSSIDSKLDENSENPVQNKIIKSALDSIEEAIGNINSILETL